MLMGLSSEDRVFYRSLRRGGLTQFQARFVVYGWLTRAYMEMEWWKEVLVDPEGTWQGRIPDITSDTREYAMSVFAALHNSSGPVKRAKP